MDKYDRQTAKFLAVVGENMPELSGKVMQGWIENPKALQKALVDALCPPVQSDLLERIATVVAPSIERFVCDDKALKGANISWTGENFKRLFMGSEEVNVPETQMVVSRLERTSLDAPILAELGEKAKTSLARLFSLLQKQAAGEEGILLTSGWANIFYVIGNDDNLWVVCACWYSVDRGWHVEAGSVEDPYAWHDGPRVFSRDS